ncbi:CaiB/BaiF CoA transferase family protein [Pseudonocardia endophytica]|uniref:Crotonobetainyl-CoA:carnitine CoA-transferase CaiB-like acyl-CoA transferase n=1 Tax=Pseudonocardia endophytica TaxID=401976 RepID=A0A4R1I130_PSEEN|nr:CoA transferase [Pseudonocardia endophytica]TCK27603.1 crotonobetainyl-CoA:carnitine CoA-transferase CaiB-like acyl-CoA transferase [Pseudonocardia endophytica]
MQTGSSALEHLRVLDFSRVLAGPFATMMLADLGAEVIKVERPGIGDETRSWGPPYDATGESTYFQSVNRNKTSVAIDLASPRGLARARSIAQDCDVVVENFRAGVMDRLGLGADELCAANPRLVYCSVTGFGRHGGADLPGYDLLVQALGGLMSITGEPDGAPQKVGVALVDVLAGLFAGVGILSALQYRERTGHGQRVEVDLLSSLLAALTNQGTAYTSGKIVPGRLGNNHPSIAPYELLECADRELAVAVGNDRQFRLLCHTVGAPHLAEDTRFATNPVRVAHREALRKELCSLLRRRPAAEWARDLTSAGVPAGVVNDIAGAFELATRLGLSPTVDLPRGPHSSVTVTRNPIGLSLTPPTYRTAPPPLAPPIDRLDPAPG